MQKIYSKSSLRAAILRLETQQDEEEKALKDQFYIVVDSFRPINLIKSTFGDVVSARNLNPDLINMATGLATSYFSKGLYKKISGGSKQKVVVMALLFGVTAFFSRNPEYLKTIVRKIAAFIHPETEDDDDDDDF